MYLLDISSVILAAVEFLRNVPEGKYDAIIVDSSDPVGMSPSIHFLFLGNLSVRCVYVCTLRIEFGKKKKKKNYRQTIAKYVSQIQK